MHGNLGSLSAQPIEQRNNNMTATSSFIDESFSIHRKQCLRIAGTCRRCLSMSSMAVRLDHSSLAFTAKQRRTKGVDNTVSQNVAVNWSSSRSVLLRRYVTTCSHPCLYRQHLPGPNNPPAATTSSNPRWMSSTRPSI